LWFEHDLFDQSERRLLAIADSGVLALSRAFPLMYDDEHVFHLTDADFAAMADALSRTSPPLLALGPATSAKRRALLGVVALTDAGRAVLSGTRDRVATCGIDRWLGGAHLVSGARVWRWDAAADRVV
jgi:hypothetical protein